MAKGRKGDSPTDTETPNSGNGSSHSSRATDNVVETVRGLAAVVAEHALSELIVDLPDATITLRRGATVQVPVPMPIAMPMPAAVPMHAHAGAPAASTSAPIAAVTPTPVDNAHVVTSPFVGTFYRRPNPDSPEYVKVNDHVNKGEVLCIVEAMKLMNEIEADVSGTIVGILAEDGAPVEYGQPLFKIAPA